MTSPTNPARPGRGRCSQCGRVLTTSYRGGEITSWLLPGRAGPVESRLCRACASHGPAARLACARCGNGPFLDGDLATAHAGPGADPAAAVQMWMTDAGWALTGPICPSCIDDLTR